MKWTKQLSYRLLHPLWIDDAKRKTALLAPWLNPGSSVLEIGCGPGTLMRELINAGYEVTSLDLEDQRVIPNLPAPVVYDGIQMPFEDSSFDVAILFTVLHHCEDPAQIFREAGRVGKKVAIVEDIFVNRAQLRLTQITDSLVNAEFTGHPHQQKSEQGWRDLFAAEGWHVVDFQTWRLFRFYRQAFFWLEPKSDVPN